MENQDTCPCTDEAVATPEITATTEKVKENEVPVSIKQTIINWKICINVCTILE